MFYKGAFFVKKGIKVFAYNLATNSSCEFDNQEKLKLTDFIKSLNSDKIRLLIENNVLMNDVDYYCYSKYISNKYKYSKQISITDAYTFNCNMNCIYCFENKLNNSKSELKYDDWGNYYAKDK